MTDDAIAKIRAGIRAYERERRVLLRWLRMRGEVSQHDFDRVFIESTKSRFRYFLRIAGDSFILAPMDPQYRWLDFLQLLEAVGDVTKRVEDSVIYCRAAA